MKRQINRLTMLHLVEKNMLGEITGWLGLTDSKKSSIRKEIDIMAAINAHIRWKIRLLNYRNGMSDEKFDPAQVCRDDLCKLGRWIHGPASKHFRRHDRYLALREKHADFHTVAGKVVQSVDNKDFEVADSLMRAEYTQISRDVVRALSDLNELL
jgi:hypothetical protein